MCGRTREWGRRVVQNESVRGKRVVVTASMMIRSPSLQENSPGIDIQFGFQGEGSANVPNVMSRSDVDGRRGTMVD